MTARPRLHPILERMLHRDCAPQAQRGAQRRPPALTGGESPDQGAKVDWLTVTWAPSVGAVDMETGEMCGRDDVAKQAFDWLSSWLGGVLGESVNGMFGYAEGVRFYVPVGGTAVHVGRVDFGGDLHGGRSRLDLSGAGCSRVQSWLAVASVLGALRDHTITRVDLAVDCIEGEYSVDDAVEWWSAGDFNAGGRNPRHSLVGDWLAPTHGRTFEVGRRENGKMLRAYEKGRQLGDQDSTWTRFEVEIRNNDRDIPLAVLTSPSEYFVGAYKCLERILDAAALRISTHQKEGAIALDVMVDYARSAYGQLVHVLRARLGASEVLDSLSRPGYPKRLERAALGGYFNAGPPPALH